MGDDNNFILIFPHATGGFHTNFMSFLDTLIKLSEIFSVSVDYLLGISDIPNPYTTENYTPKEADIVSKIEDLRKKIKSESMNGSVPCLIVRYNCSLYT